MKKGRGAAVAGDDKPVARKRQTTFPVSRIKKLMQSDAEMGKVKKESLTLISTAIELFLKEFVQAAHAEAAKDDSKRVTVAHLKKVAETDARFGFLLSSLGSEAIEKAAVEDAEPKSKKAKPEK